MDDEELIECVRQFPEIFDMSHRKYIDNPWKTQVWRDIGRTLNQDPLKCKARWESMRGQFRKYVRSLRTVTGQPSSSTTKFKYSELLEFLRPHIKDKRRIPSVVCEDVSFPELITDVDDEIRETSNVSAMPLQSSHMDDTLSDSQTRSDWLRSKLFSLRNPDNPPETASTVLIKHILDSKDKKTKQVIENRDDEIDHFFASMKGSYRKFSVLEQLQAKQEIFNIITKIELKRCEQQNCHEPTKQQNHNHSDN